MSWLDKFFNPTVAPPASATVQGILQLAGDLGGTAAAPVIASIAGVGGLSTVTAADLRNAANGKITFDTLPVNLATTDATALQTLQTFALASTTGVYKIRSLVSCTNSTTTISGLWIVDTTIRNNAGTLTQVAGIGAAAVVNDYFVGGTLGATSVAVALSGTNVLIQVTGVAATNLTWTSNGFKNLSIL